MNRINGRSDDRTLEYIRSLSIRAITLALLLAPILVLVLILTEHHGLILLLGLAQILILYLTMALNSIRHATTYDECIRRDEAGAAIISGVGRNL